MENYSLYNDIISNGFGIESAYKNIAPGEHIIR
jgi:hypothetical protein